MVISTSNNSLKKCPFRDVLFPFSYAHDGYAIQSIHSISLNGIMLTSSLFLSYDDEVEDSTSIGEELHSRHECKTLPPYLRSGEADDLAAACLPPPPLMIFHLRRPRCTGVLAVTMAGVVFTVRRLE